MGEGILIAVDGIDGAGKTTQVRLLESALAAVGETVLVAKEPTTGPWGQKLRASAFSGRLPPDEELHAFIEDRREHLRDVVRPALAAGEVVILDRYYYSTLAYQGARLGSMAAITAQILDGVELPDITFLLDLDLDTALARIQRRDGQGNAFEARENLAAVQRLFHQLCESDARVHCLEGVLPPDAIHQTIVALLLDGPLRAKRCFKGYGCDEPMTCGYRMSGMCRWARLFADLRVVRTPAPYPALRHPSAVSPL